MQLNDLRTFTVKLQQVAILNYISKNGLGEFYVVTKKNQKNLTTEDIATLATGYFDLLSNDKTLLFAEKKQLESEFAASLKVYSARVYRSKPWYQKIAAFFGFQSDAEKRISRVANDLFAKIHQQNKVNADIEVAKTQQSYFLIFNSFIPLPAPSCNNDLKLFYHKTAENMQKIDYLDGMIFYQSFDSIIEDLQVFQKRNGSKFVEKLIEEFKFARAINFLQVQRYDEDLLAKSLIEKLSKLPVSTKDDKNYMILPGGFNKHAALYIIEKHENGKYSFRVVNTGAGASLFRDASPATSVAKDDNTLAVCNQFTNLDEKQLSQNFFKELLKVTKNSSNMYPVNQYIKLRLTHDSNFTQNSVHEAQRHGTCSMRCLFAFLNIELDVVASQKFNRLVLDREIERFDNSPTIQVFAKMNPQTYKLRANAVAQRAKYNDEE